MEPTKAPADFSSNPGESGYRHCSCRDCFELCIGKPGAMCDDCESRGCDNTASSECQAYDLTHPELFEQSED